LTFMRFRGPQAHGHSLMVAAPPRRHFPLHVPASQDVY
jgi:hypothetical protein